MLQLFFNESNPCYHGNSGKQVRPDTEQAVRGQS